MKSEPAGGCRVTAGGLATPPGSKGRVGWMLHSKQHQLSLPAAREKRGESINIQDD